MVIAKISNEFVNCDSPFDHVRERSEAIVSQEIEFAIHLAIEKIMIELPDLETCKSVSNLSRILNKYLEDITVIQKFLIKVRIPGDDDEAEKMYSRFLQFKALCHHSVKIAVVLELGANLPSQEILDRFWGETVHAVHLSIDLFVTNSQKYPVLSKRHQQVVKQYMRSQATIFVRARHPNDDITDQLQYVAEHLFKNHDKLDKEE